MERKDHRLAFIVPTMDREPDLRRLLESTRAQDVRPHQIVVVDAGTPPVEHLLAEFPDLAIDYVRHLPPSLAHQRNAGIARLRDDITLAGFLDDDIVLQPGALRAMLDHWATAPADLGGSRFNIVDEPHPRLVPLKSFFLLDHRRRGRVLRSGFQSSISATERDLDVDWLSGGATVWRRDVVAGHPYDEWFEGFGYLEDVEYSYRVRRHYRLDVVADAKVLHLHRPPRPDRQRMMGRWEVVNRKYFVDKDDRLSRPAFYWAVAGMIVLNAARAAFLRDREVLDRTKGNIKGLLEVAAGKVRQSGGHVK